jgi:hypothetical protein
MGFEVAYRPMASHILWFVPMFCGKNKIIQSYDFVSGTHPGQQNFFVGRLRIKSNASKICRDFFHQI